MQHSFRASRMGVAGSGGAGETMNILSDTLLVGQDVVQTVRPYFELFRDDGFAPALSLGLLVAAAIFGTVFLLRYVLLVWWSLWRQTRFVRRTGSYEGFAEHFEAVDNTLSANRRIRHAWQEFKETLILPNAARGDEKPYIIQRAHTIISTLTKPGCNFVSSALCQMHL